MHELMNYVCDELEELEKKASKGGKLSMSEIDYADKLAHLKKNLLRADEIMDEGYSGDAYLHDGRSFARGRGSNAMRDSRGRYSSDGRYSRRYSMDGESVVQELRDIMESAPEHMKSEIQRTITRMEQM